MNVGKTNESIIFRRDDPKSNVPLSTMRQSQTMVARGAEVEKTVMLDDLSKIKRMLDKPIVYRVRSRGRSPVRVRRRSSSRSRKNKSPHSRRRFYDAS